MNAIKKFLIIIGFLIVCELSLIFTEPSYGKIAFVSGRHGNFEICVANADGWRVKRLTRSAEDDLNPVWSPDGTKIAFVVEHDESSDIYVMDADGSNVKKLTNDKSDRNITYDVYIMNADGTNVQRITTDPDFDGFPAWSPDGTKIAVSRGMEDSYDIYVIDVDGSSEVNVTNSSVMNSDPVWSSDGTRIVFASKRGWGYDIYMMHADGSNLKRLHYDLLNIYTDFQPSWYCPDALPDPTSVLLRKCLHVGLIAAIIFSVVYFAFISLRRRKQPDTENAMRGGTSSEDKQSRTR